MRKIMVYLISLVMLLSGCGTISKYYTDPTSKGYNKPYFDASCQSCKRIFQYSQATFDSNSGKGVCPYCGQEQDLTMAKKRYDYDKQVADEQKREKEAEERKKERKEARKVHGGERLGGDPVHVIIDRVQVNR